MVGKSKKHNEGSPALPPLEKEMRSFEDAHMHFTGTNKKVSHVTYIYLCSTLTAEGKAGAHTVFQLGVATMHSARLPSFSFMNVISCTSF